MVCGGVRCSALLKMTRQHSNQSNECSLGNQSSYSTEKRAHTYFEVVLTYYVRRSLFLESESSALVRSRLRTTHSIIHALATDQPLRSRSCPDGHHRQLTVVRYCCSWTTLHRDVRRLSELPLIPSGRCWFPKATKTKHSPHRSPYKTTATVTMLFLVAGGRRARVVQQIRSSCGLRFWCAATAIRTPSSPWRAWYIAPELS